MNPGSSSSQERLEHTESLSISPEVFEKLYLSPKNAVAGDLRKTFGNPTPVGLAGFVIAVSPLSAELMGWRGATGLSATIGVNYFFGGMLLIIAAILEFFLGNTFPTVVFFGYGAHFLTFGSTFQPFYAAVSSYTTDGSQQQTPAFASSFGFYVLFMGVLSFVFLICSLRTNIVFVLIFIAATLGFCLAAGAFWTTAQGMAIGAILLKGTGGAFFAAAMFGWYLLAVIMFATLDLPFLGQLPVGDLSTVVKGRSQMKEV
ncbi:transcriptional activator of ethanol catabolism AlcS [Hyaloscypha bicolor E]|uniref:Transcriptional activator of ethanol catabolism AlcS n=1 Tax=Hyaloscypha bicolor E TaxID=1095630 RepID=A0A2J6TFU5_9HELO|nr:transcriptional activator of ethanol catabolism AlcS [Hyaloscypha bicolor E]PMD61894.1 transcriptional activator of ethanol catabolism AlcS [Hyaloscypha bicolor E]